MLLKFSLIIFLITIQLFAEVPLTINEQVKDNEQYKTCKNIKDLDQRFNCERAIEKPFIERGIDQFIQSFDPKFQSSVKNNISRLDLNQQGDLLDLYVNIAPLLDKNHTQKELTKIKYNLVYYMVAVQNFTGGCETSAKMIFQAAPELKDATFNRFSFKKESVYSEIMEQAAVYDKIANISPENANNYFEDLKIYYKKRERDIIDLNVDNSNTRFFLNSAIDYSNMAIDYLNKGDVDLAKKLLRLSYHTSDNGLNAEIQLQTLFALLSKEIVKHK
jgi:hypothetical protein